MSSIKSNNGDVFKDTPEPCVTALEFYSGIGGMHYAFKKALNSRPGKILAAFDINEVANETYKFNFKEEVNLDNLIQVSKLKKYKADLYLMSPPCQPYTRTGLQQQSGDPRSCSFLKFLTTFPQLVECGSAPNYIFIENVFGFESSDTRDLLVKTLSSCDYHFQEFLINPIDLGIPNSRLRYYFMAKHKSLGDFGVPELNGKLFYSEKDSLRNNSSCFSPDILNTVWNSILQDGDCPKLEDFFQHSLFEERSKLDYQIPEKIFSKYSQTYDIVNPQQTRSCCFTKGYSKFAQATGSILNLGSKDNGVVWEDHRYFSEYEIAQLLGFPVNQPLVSDSSSHELQFSFPESVSLKQRYKLLGNSLSITVVSKLLTYLLCP